MNLFSVDKKALRVMKKVQQYESAYILLDTNNEIHFSEECDSEHIDIAMRSKPYKVRLPKGCYFDASLASLIKEDCVQRIGLSPFYQVTHDGWHYSSAIRHELLMLVVTHFFFPSLVAFITTLITIWLTK